MHRTHRRSGDASSPPEPLHQTEESHHRQFEPYVFSAYHLPLASRESEVQPVAVYPLLVSLGHSAVSAVPLLEAVVSQTEAVSALSEAG